MPQEVLRPGSASALDRPVYWLTAVVAIVIASRGHRALIAYVASDPICATQGTVRVTAITRAEPARLFTSGGW